MGRGGGRGIGSGLIFGFNFGFFITFFCGRRSSMANGVGGLGGSLLGRGMVAGVGATLPSRIAIRAAPAAGGGGGDSRHS